MGALGSLIKLVRKFSIKSTSCLHQESFYFLQKKRVRGHSLCIKPKPVKLVKISPWAYSINFYTCFARRRIFSPSSILLENSLLTAVLKTEVWETTGCGGEGKPSIKVVRWTHNPKETPCN